MTRKQKIIGAVLAIVFGALGSGLWELVNPYLGAAMDWSLSIATLGMQSLTDDLYYRAAQSIESPTSIKAGINLLIMLSCLTLGVIIQVYLKVVYRSKDLFDISKALLLWSYGLITLACIYIVSHERTTYIIDLARYRYSLEVMARPYITEQQVFQLRASHIQVKTREEFIESIGKLQKIIKDAGGDYRERDFF
ncbi:MAG: hypothetical protein AAF542_00055 [Pseudomonadota bacterium]